MNSGQSMLVLGAFTMLSILSLNVNRMMFSSLVLGLEMEAMINVISYGQSMLDEVLAKSFDENSADESERLYDPSQATPEAAFGPDGAGEAINGIDSLEQSRSKFDDVDDYHLYRRKVWDPRLGWSFIVDSVYYVSEVEPDVRSAARTFYKVVTVTVWNASLPKREHVPEETIPVILRDVAVYRRYF